MKKSCITLLLCAVGATGLLTGCDSPESVLVKPTELESSEQLLSDFKAELRKTYHGISSGAQLFEPTPLMNTEHFQKHKENLGVLKVAEQCSLKNALWYDGNDLLKKIENRHLKLTTETQDCIFEISARPVDSVLLNAFDPEKTKQYRQADQIFSATLDGIQKDSVMTYYEYFRLGQLVNQIDERTKRLTTTESDQAKVKSL